MNCTRVLSRLHAYADGELSRLRGRRVARHLAKCASCRTSLSELQELEALLSEVPVPPLPGGFSERVLAEAARRAPVRRPAPLFDDLPSGVRMVLLGISLPMRVAACSTAVLACLLGVTTAGRLSVSPGPEPASGSARELYGLEWFGSAPPISIAAAYLPEASPNSQEGMR